jgi:hypothetical protein
MARIGIDALHVSQSGKGLARFELCLVEALAAQTCEHQFVVFVNARGDLRHCPQRRMTYVPVRKLNFFIWSKSSAWRPGAGRSICYQTMSDRVRCC